MAENAVIRIMSVSRQIAIALATGRIATSQILCGPPGVGKTLVFTQSFAEAGRRVRKIKSSTTLGLLEQLQDATIRKEIALFDDADKVWHDMGRLQILMCAMAPQAEGSRIYTHSTVKGPTTYCFDGLVCVIISNINIRDTSQVGGKTRHAVEALCSRTPPIVLEAPHEDIYEFTVYLAIEKEILRSSGYNLAVSNDALRYFATNRYRMNDVSPRRLKMIAEKRRDFPDIWEDLLFGILDNPIENAASIGEIPQII